MLKFKWIIIFALCMTSASKVRRVYYKLLKFSDPNIFACEKFIDSRNNETCCISTAHLESVGKSNETGQILLKTNETFLKHNETQTNNDNYNSLEDPENTEHAMYLISTKDNIPNNSTDSIKDEEILIALKPSKTLLKQLLEKLMPQTDNNEAQLRTVHGIKPMYSKIKDIQILDDNDNESDKNMIIRKKDSQQPRNALRDLVFFSPTTQIPKKHSNNTKSLNPTNEVNNLQILETENKSNGESPLFQQSNNIPTSIMPDQKYSDNSKIIIKTNRNDNLKMRQYLSMKEKNDTGTQNKSKIEVKHINIPTVETDRKYSENFKINNNTRTINNMRFDQYAGYMENNNSDKNNTKSDEQRNKIPTTQITDQKHSNNSKILNRTNDMDNLRMGKFFGKKENNDSDTQNKSQSAIRRMNKTKTGETDPKPTEKLIIPVNTNKTDNLLIEKYIGSTVNNNSDENTGKSDTKLINLPSSSYKNENDSDGKYKSNKKEGYTNNANNVTSNQKHLHKNKSSTTAKVNDKWQSGRETSAMETNVSFTKNITNERFEYNNETKMSRNLEKSKQTESDKNLPTFPVTVSLYDKSPTQSFNDGSDTKVDESDLLVQRNANRIHRYTKSSKTKHVTLNNLQKVNDTRFKDFLKYESLPITKGPFISDDDHDGIIKYDTGINLTVLINQTEDNYNDSLINKKATEQAVNTLDYTPQTFVPFNFTVKNFNNEICITESVQTFKDANDSKTKDVHGLPDTVINAKNPTFLTLAPNKNDDINVTYGRHSTQDLGCRNNDFTVSSSSMNGFVGSNKYYQDFRTDISSCNVSSSYNVKQVYVNKTQSLVPQTSGFSKELQDSNTSQNKQSVNEVDQIILTQKNVFIEDTKNKSFKISSFTFHKYIANKFETPNISDNKSRVFQTDNLENKTYIRTTPNKHALLKGDNKTNLTDITSTSSSSQFKEQNMLSKNPKALTYIRMHINSTDPVEQFSMRDILEHNDSNVSTETVTNNEVINYSNCNNNGMNIKQSNTVGIQYNGSNTLLKGFLSRTNFQNSPSPPGLLDNNTITNDKNTTDLKQVHKHDFVNMPQDLVTQFENLYELKTVTNKVHIDKISNVINAQNTPLTSGSYKCDNVSKPNYSNYSVLDNHQNTIQSASTNNPYSADIVKLTTRIPFLNIETKSQNDTFLNKIIQHKIVKTVSANKINELNSSRTKSTHTMENISNTSSKPQVFVPTDLSKENIETFRKLITENRSTSVDTTYIDLTAAQNAGKSTLTFSNSIAMQSLTGNVASSTTLPQTLSYIVIPKNISEKNMNSMDKRLDLVHVNNTKNENVSHVFGKYNELLDIRSAYQIEISPTTFPGHHTSGANRENGSIKPVSINNYKFMVNSKTNLFDKSTINPTVITLTPSSVNNVNRYCFGGNHAPNDVFLDQGYKNNNNTDVTSHQPVTDILKYTKYPLAEPAKKAHKLEQKFAGNFESIPVFKLVNMVIQYNDSSDSARISNIHETSFFGISTQKPNMLENKDLSTYANGNDLKNNSTVNQPGMRTDDNVLHIESETTVLFHEKISQSPTIKENIKNNVDNVNSKDEGVTHKPQFTNANDIQNQIQKVSVDLNLGNTTPAQELNNKPTLSSDVNIGAIKISNLNETLLTFSLSSLPVKHSAANVVSNNLSDHSTNNRIMRLPNRKYPAIANTSQPEMNLNNARISVNKSELMAHYLTTKTSETLRIISKQTEQNLSPNPVLKIDMCQPNMSKFPFNLNDVNNTVSELIPVKVSQNTLINNSQSIRKFHQQYILRNKTNSVVNTYLDLNDTIKSLNREITRKSDLSKLFTEAVILKEANNNNTQNPQTYLVTTTGAIKSIQSAPKGLLGNTGSLTIISENVPFRKNIKLNGSKEAFVNQSKHVNHKCNFTTKFKSAKWGIKDQLLATYQSNKTNISLHSAVGDTRTKINLSQKIVDRLNKNFPNHQNKHQALRVSPTECPSDCYPQTPLPKKGSFSLGDTGLINKWSYLTPVKRHNPWQTYKKRMKKPIKQNKIKKKCPELYYENKGNWFFGYN